MIAFIRGTVDRIEEDTVIIDKGGVGIEVTVPMSMLRPMPVPGQELTLHTHLQVKEDGWQLYGFSLPEQLRVFRLLISVSGIGARTAVAILDKIPAERFPQIMAAGEVAPLTAVSGVGKKTAERILLELKDKFPKAEVETLADGGISAAEEVDKDLLAALKQLGYSATEARAFALKAMADLGAEASSEALLRQALKIAMRS